MAADDTGLDEAYDAKTEILSLCFERNSVADSVPYWEGCIIPTSKAFKTCEDLCSSTMHLGTGVDDEYEVPGGRS